MILTGEEGKRLLAARGVSVAGEGAALGRMAIRLDRDRRCHALVVERDGKPLSLSIDPFTGLLAFVLRRAAKHLAVPEEGRVSFEALVRVLYALALSDALRVEIDPVLARADGTIAAGEVAMEFDRIARFRHPEWAEYGERLPGTAAEQAFMRLGAVAAEPDPQGRIVAVVSGAGLMMTVLDMLTAMKATVRCVVDMQGLPLQGIEVMRSIFENAGRMSPKITLIGGRFQAPVADRFAEAVIAANKLAPLTGRVVTWIAGNRAPEAQAMFAAAGFEPHDDMRAALAAVAEDR